MGVYDEFVAMDENRNTWNDDFEKWLFAHGAQLLDEATPEELANAFRRLFIRYNTVLHALESPSPSNLNADTVLK